MQDSSLLHIKFVVIVLANFIQVIWDCDVFWKIFLPQFDFSMPFKLCHPHMNAKLYGLLPVDEEK